MTTQQNDTAALTDEQLEGVAGGGMRGSFIMISPVPTPIQGVRLVSAQPLPSPSPGMGVRYVSIDPVPFP